MKNMSLDGQRDDVDIYELIMNNKDTGIEQFRNDLTVE